MGEHYAFWLAPAPECAAGMSSWAELIAELSRHYDTPCFAPHVTLLGGVSGSASGALGEIVGDLEEAVAGVSAAAEIVLRPDELVCGDSYFRCLYVRAEETPGLLDLRRAVVGRFGDASGEAPGDAYEPHLSLVYDNSLSASRCAELKARVKRTKLSCERWTARHVDVVRISARPDEWRTEARVALPPTK